MVRSVAMTQKNSIEQLFVYTQLNDQTVLFQTQFKLHESFVFPQFKCQTILLTHKMGLSGVITPGQKRCQLRGTPRPQKLQYYWSLTIRLFNVISGTLVNWGLTPLQRCCRYILQLLPNEHV